ncbi:hypothetical protein [Ruminiclostridium cellobioparum]|uniref:Uncharacterized protein n=1 Tax=Ruminiclostridium cellobioparum subsp. termitidis CT1112 TaxID=1195236 RepID=S0FZR4_RUMCE|nr:hypothetical protein [Ruminiclostridium cellobioparum]EMS74033.1 hypothetical protein CTER_5136 [Ruminiclostridium cellobioparum subsp. termitidis CT1112]
MNIPENTYLSTTTEYHYVFPPNYSTDISLTYSYNNNDYGCSYTIYEGGKEVTKIFCIKKYSCKEEALEDCFKSLLEWAEKREIND